MSESTGSKLIIPSLGGLYNALDPIAWPLLRFATGAIFVPHGMQKLFGAFGGAGISGTGGFLEKVGYGMPYAWATIIALLEFFGGIALALGFLTRPVALAFAIFMLNAAIFHSANGFFWTQAGLEYPLLWMAICLVIFIRGAGPMSIDKALGREF